MLETPELDDRSFDELVQNAEARVRQLCPEWTDFGPGDPGRTLVEAFAYLTEVLIWRANRLPEAAYVEFLARMGVQMGAPAAASTKLTFQREDTAGTLTIPAGTTVSAETGDAKGEAVVFRTLQALRLSENETSGDVRAANAELVAGEILGVSTGQSGQSFHVARAPILAPLGAPLDLAIGVETPRNAIPQDAEPIEIDGVVYVLWKEVARFSEATSDQPVFTADRMTGLIQFAPDVRLNDPDASDASLVSRGRPVAAAPPQDRRIRAWYRIGGGEAGNVVADVLTRTDLDGVTVTNPSAASGGRSAETLANALLRGPHEVASRGRAVTASDYEALAIRQPSVDRARAYAKADDWGFATRGTVDIVLTPYLPETRRESPLVRETLEAACTDDALHQTQQELDRHRPLGASCTARWVRFKPVRIRVRAALRPYVDANEVAARLQRALDEMLSPLNAKDQSGWTFGEPLRSWRINDVARRQPEIVYLEDPIIETPEAPDDVCSAIVPDHTQPGLWYAGCGNAVYRSINNGLGWELSGTFGDETVKLIETPAAWHNAPELRGLIAAITEGDDGGCFYVSRNCGEDWDLVLRFDAGTDVQDLDFLMRDDCCTVLFAASDGLREFSLDRDKTWRLVSADDTANTRKIWAVTVARNPAGSEHRYSVMFSGDGEGLFYSAKDGVAGTYKAIGPAGEEKSMFRSLRTHEYGGQARIWAGVRVAEGITGPGCFEYRITGNPDDEPAIRPYSKGWKGESCRGIAFMGETVLVATHRAGIQSLSLSDSDPTWRPSDVNCGLPQRQLDLLQPINVLAATPSHAMAGPGKQDDGDGGGLYLTEDGRAFGRCSSRTHVGSVSLPQNWLFCSAGAHKIEEVTHAG